MHTHIHPGIPTGTTRGTPSKDLSAYGHGALTLFGKSFQTFDLDTLGPRGPEHHISPNFSNGDSVCPVPFPFATTSGNRSCFLFLSVLRCISSTRSRRSELRHLPVLTAGRFPIQEPPDQWVLAPTRSFRRLTRPSSVTQPRHPPAYLCIRDRNGDRQLTQPVDPPFYAYTWALGACGLKRSGEPSAPYTPGPSIPSSSGALRRHLSTPSPG